MFPWYWRSLPLNHLTGSQVFEALFYHPQAIATLLESPYPTPKDHPQLSRYSICAGKPRIIAGKTQLWTPPLGQILPFLKSRLKSNTKELNSPAHLPFLGGWLGWLGYDIAWEIEKLPQINPDHLPFPVAYWYEPASFAILDHQEQILWLATSDPSHLDPLQNRLETQNTTPSSLISEPVYPDPLPLSFQSNAEDYQNSVRKALKYIQAGDIFQTNLSLRFQTLTTDNSWSIYQRLQEINPSPFASYWQTPWGTLISCSPERLIQRRGETVQTRPIAGTRARGINTAQDEALEQELISNSKEIAEHIMLVDLERNDLGRVCQWGTVKVDELLVIEKYSHVMHLVSNITGILKPEYDSVDLVGALFPGGTITGCPKVRCMEIIEELEPVRRNLFYGSCGYLDQRGNLDLNILIRTLLYTSFRDENTSPLAQVWGQVGAGIVADSDPEKEWHESLNKAQAQLTALKLISPNSA